MRQFVQHPLVLRLCALLLGGSLVFAYAPFDWGILGIIAPTLHILLVWQQQPRETAKISYWFGLGWFAAGLSWIYVSIDQYGGLPWFATVGILLLLFAYLALFPALAFGLWQWLRNKHRAATFTLPLLWLAAESLRGWLLTGFPWLSLGYTQTDGWLGQLAPWIGEVGITVVVLWIALCLAMVLRTRQPLLLLIPLVAWACAYVLPQFSSLERTGKTHSVLLVQGNVSQSLKWQAEQRWPTLLKYLDLTRPHYDHQVIVWPESAITALEPYAGDVLASINDAANYNNSAIISGIIDYKQQTDEFYNSIIVLGKRSDDDPSSYRYGSSNRYQKHHLLPIGEFVPFGDLLRPLAPLFNLPMSSFSRGAYRQDNIIANNLKFSPAICYEMAFPEQLRENTRADTDALLTVSNDTWFGDSHGPWQHMEIARMRAKELGRPMLRATNNGVSGIVDERGRWLARAPQFTATVLSADIPEVSGTTSYWRFGSLWAWLLGCLGILPLLAGLVRQKSLG
ncbi:apolipoprotein N-acyltransferase [Idiomarina tyrosinivorans]|uniref:Apolipoprotein N-acyltransferase n=1 Tax=Idiomarina tyrosinivorans TaxID=1445662 RepID=A0A432ZRJ3_9GAMM|nr:apolipoprotein N-acyltransferase [Idiomarina tyrosinivorans]RUO80458.1 apolipoprotein N-acyltransferase [Idiomarina tyrosinivorans]